MARSRVSRAQENKAIRQAALREQLANTGLVNQIIEISDKMADLSQDIEALEFNRLKAAGLTPRRRSDRVYFDDPDGLEVQVAARR